MNPGSPGTRSSPTKSEPCRLQDGNLVNKMLDDQVV